MTLNRLLVANRGEVAIRIIRAAADLGITTVAIHPADDALSLHLKYADDVVPLDGSGAAAYLHVEQVVGAAVDAGCDAPAPRLRIPRRGSTARTPLRRARHHLRRPHGRPARALRRQGQRPRHRPAQRHSPPARHRAGDQQGRRARILRQPRRRRQHDDQGRRRQRRAWPPRHLRRRRDRRRLRTLPVGGGSRLRRRRPLRGAVHPPRPPHRGADHRRRQRRRRSAGGARVQHPAATPERRRDRARAQLQPGPPRSDHRRGRPLRPQRPLSEPGHVRVPDGRQRG